MSATSGGGAVGLGRSALGRLAAASMLHLRGSCKSSLALGQMKLAHSGTWAVDDDDDGGRGYIQRRRVGRAQRSPGRSAAPWALGLVLGAHAAGTSTSTGQLASPTRSLTTTTTTTTSSSAARRHNGNIAARSPRVHFPVHLLDHVTLRNTHRTPAPKSPYHDKPFGLLLLQ